MQLDNTYFVSDGSVTITKTEATFTGDSGNKTGGRIIYDKFLPDNADVAIEAEISCSTTTGFCTTFTFLEDYSRPANSDPPQDEIDFEMLGKNPTEIQMVTFKDGKVFDGAPATWTVKSTGDFHTYKIVFRLNSYVEFYIDNQLAHRQTTNIPRRPVKLAFSLWRPNNNWSGTYSSDASATAVVKFPIKVNYQGDKYFVIEHILSGRRLDGGANDNSVYKLRNGVNEYQIWRFLDAGNDYFYFEHKMSGRRLDGGADDDSVYKLNTGNENPYQMWKLINAPNGLHIEHKMSGKHLDGNSDNDKVYKTPYGYDNPYQVWALKDPKSIVDDASITYDAQLEIGGFLSYSHIKLILRKDGEQKFYFEGDCGGLSFTLGGSTWGTLTLSKDPQLGVSQNFELNTSLVYCNVNIWDGNNGTISFHGGGIGLNGGISGGSGKWYQV